MLPLFPLQNESFHFFRFKILSNVFLLMFASDEKLGGHKKQDYILSINTVTVGILTSYEWTFENSRNMS